MRPDDLALMRTPGTPTVSPDGRMAVVAVSRCDPAADVVRGQLWAVPTDGSAPARPLTSGAHDSAPAFSPDGRWLAYLSAAPGGPPQVALLPTAGGAPRRLTDAPLGAGAPVWSPDSGRLAWVAPVAGPADDGPRLVTGLSARAGAPRTAVVVLDLPADPLDDAVPPPAPRLLTDGTGGDTDVAWSPDGGSLAFVSARHRGADRDRVRDVYVVPLSGGRPRRVTRSRGECRQPVFDPSGTSVLVTARPDLGPDGLDASGPAVLCRVSVGGGELHPVLDPAGHPRDDGTPPTVLDGAAALVAVERRGAVELRRVPLGGGPAETLVDGPFTVRGFAAAAGVVVATVAHDRSAGELVAVTPGRRRLLTGFGSPLGATERLHRTTARAAVAPDGGGVHGWLTVPAGPGPLPLLVLVPGGRSPRSGWSLDDAVQAHASAGYAVLRVDAADPRDSVLALLDAVLADPALDAGRVGVLGGAAAARLLEGTDRFAAAVVEEEGDDPWADAPDVAGVVTPTLVVQAERDPAGRGRRLFVALQRRGVPSALLLLPGDGQRPRHRPARLEHLLDWWDRWLPAGALPEEDADLPGADLPGGGHPRAEAAG
jgi:dipeptidyl aminopeptidase/acylaminoacyl peptidase